MGEKSDQKREYILEKAKGVFVKKGFLRVTMKDIVEACNISRGGLYLYFSSTEELFAAILSKQLEDEEDLSSSLAQTTNMADILMLFLKEQKKMILGKKENMNRATYEYFFAHKPEDRAQNMIRNQFKAGVRILARILEKGTLQRELYCENPKQEARNLMYSIEGMKICAQTMGLSESQVDRELLYLISGFLLEE